MRTIFGVMRLFVLFILPNQSSIHYYKGWMKDIQCFDPFLFSLSSTSDTFIQAMIRLWFLLLAYVSYVHAYFSTPNMENTLPFKSAIATAQRNNSMILFGGENATTWYTNDLYQLEATSTGFEWRALPQNNPPPPTINARAVYMESMDAMIMLGGFTQTTANVYMPIQVYTYFFANQTWVPAASNNEVNDTIVPANRRDFAVAADQQNNHIYIYGGSLNDTAIYNDLWILDTVTMTFTQLPPTDVGHYSHSISLLRQVLLTSSHGWWNTINTFSTHILTHIYSNNALVVTGGVRVDANLTKRLAPMDQLYVFNTQTNTWSIATTSGTVPSTRANHNAVVGKMLHKRSLSPVYLILYAFFSHLKVPMIESFYLVVCVSRKGEGCLFVSKIGLSR